jgi:DNA-directed RNA polymerase subunit RPC12/RpoP
VKVSCSQCGASIPVLDRDFYLRCPHCDARILIREPGESVLITRPAVEEDRVRRLFPSGAGVRARLRYFPYVRDGIRAFPFFNQPVSELGGYSPPAGDAAPFDTDLVEPDQLIPLLDDPGGNSIVYHPFYVVTSEGKPDAVYIDAVTGQTVSGWRMPGGKSARPSENFVKALAIGLAASVCAYAGTLALGWDAASGLGASIVASFGSVAVIYATRRIG